MYCMAVEENRGFLSIANELNAKGYITSAGGHWGAASVQVILRNPALNGTMVYGRKAKKASVLDDALVTVKGVFPKILDDQEWAALAGAFVQSSSRATHKRTSQNKPTSTSRLPDSPARWPICRLTRNLPCLGLPGGPFGGVPSITRFDMGYGAG